MSRVSPQADFRMSIDDEDIPSVIQVEGELDSLTAAQLREQLAAALEYESTVIDLRDVAFVDSAGLGALIGGVRRIREAGGGVAICCTRPSIRRLLGMTGFDRLVPVTSSLAEARRLVADSASNP